jgi:2-polyprenyl-3-methyl-5-hydroxy-6-metoxy-1,4-benzoquinol methylase
MDAQRIDRERRFHNNLAETEFAARRLVNRLSWSFYGKSETSVLWGPIWSKINVSGKRVLDYGCGDGQFSVRLACMGAFVEGIDISDSVVELAARSVPEGIPEPKFSVRDAHVTGFPNDSFDYVFGNGVLHHLVLRDAYREIARVLKPGGKAFFMEPLNHHPLLVLFRKATPSLRSKDEKPMNLDEIKMAHQFFQNVHWTEHFLVAVLGAPVHLVSNKTALWLVGALDRFDRGLIHVFPRLGRYAWLTMLELEKV